MLSQIYAALAALSLVGLGCCFFPLLEREPTGIFVEGLGGVLEDAPRFIAGVRWSYIVLIVVNSVMSLYFDAQGAQP